MRLCLVSLVVAGLSALVLEPQPVFDPYAWLIWGRELSGFDLDTGAAVAPSWKPLPALVCALLAPLGDAAPAAWVILARAGFVAMVLLAARLALALVPGAGRARRWAVAGGAIVVALLLFDTVTPVVRQFHGGLSEPLCAAFVLAAALAFVERRLGRVLVFLALAACLRPEALVVLALYGAWLWRRDRRLAAVAPGAIAGVALLWLVPDLIGSGDALSGAERARAGGVEPLDAAEALGNALAMPLWAVWAGAAWALVQAHRRGERPPLQIAAAAGVWVAIVAAMAVAGYAGIPRFVLPAVMPVAVIGVAGLVDLAAVLAEPDRRRSPALAAAAVVLLAGVLVQTALRIADLPGDLDGAEQRGEIVAGAARLGERLGPERLMACGRIYVSDSRARTGLAWGLQSGMDRIYVLPPKTPLRAGTVALGPDRASVVAQHVEAAGDVLGAARGWTAYRLPCQGVASPSATVAGAASGAAR
jgi:hypothetical protein